MVKTIKSIKVLSSTSLEPGLFLIDDGEEESQTSTAADLNVTIIALQKHNTQ